MTVGYTAMQQHSNRCSSSAVACTSVRLGLILDTVIVAVSILIALILDILLGISSRQLLSWYKKRLQ